MSIRAKAKMSGDVVTVKMLLKHPMETGLRIDTVTGEKIPAHHISEVTGSWNENVVFSCNLGPAVSKNPYLSFKLKGPKVGDTLEFASVDNKGETDTGSVVIK
jgi:sulfur-oxidizing protein SoxZ